MADDDKKSIRKSSQTDVNSFLRKVAAAPITKPTNERGRLIFAMDATASREPTWDRACHIQGEMFSETAALGGLEIQLCYYRGFCEFHSTPWLSRAEDLLARMTGVRCLGGHTQIARVLRHALDTGNARKAQALVFVGDCMEEDPDKLCDLAGRLGLLGVPVFLFHEGGDTAAAKTFRQIAQLSRGAYCRFDVGSAKQLHDLLSAVAVYAAGGRRALQDFSKGRGADVQRLTHQLTGK